MKRILLILVALSLIACGQSYQDTTLSINMGLSNAPQGLVNNVDAYLVFVETFPQGQQAQLYQGMSLEEARNLNTTIGQVNISTPYGHLFQANGDYYTFCVFAVDNSGNEAEWFSDAFNLHRMRSGTAGGRLPNQPSVTVHNYYVEVIVE